MLLTLAWRNIWRNKTRSIILILSVITGIWAGSMLTGVMNGMYGQRQEDAIKDEISSIQIHEKEFKADHDPRFIIPNGSEVLNKIRVLKEAKAVSGRIIAPGMILTAGSSAGVKINGIQPQDEAGTRGLNNKIVLGEYFVSDKHNQVLIGQKLADKMKVKENSRVVLTFEDLQNNVVSASFKIIGTFKTNNPNYDEANLYVRKQDLSELLGIGDNIHEIAILLSNKESIDKVQKQLKSEYPALTIENWREVAPDISLMIDMGAGSSKIIMIIILFALAFGIINTMLMAMLERKYEIGMMLALGMNKVRLFSLIVLETILLVMTGVPFGLLLSYSAIKFFAKHGINLGYYGKGLESFGMSHIIRPHVSMSQYAEILVLVFITAVIASLFPARKAVKIDPAESIKT